MLAFFVGLVGVAVGILMVWKPRAFLGSLGQLGWADKFFGPGHESTAYQTIGLILIIVSFMVMTGMVKGIILWVFTSTLR